MMCFAEGIHPKTMKLALFLILLVGGSLLATVLILAWIPRGNGVEEAKTYREIFHLGEQIYGASGCHYYYFHGISEDGSILIGDLTISGVRAGMSNIHIPVDVSSFHLRDRIFSIDALGYDYIILTWVE